MRKRDYNDGDIIVTSLVIIAVAVAFFLCMWIASL